MDDHVRGSVESSPNILKTRDDAKPVSFRALDSGEELQFSLSEGSSASWAKASGPFGPERLRARIEPWLTALCQSEHLSLLLGAGVSSAIHRIATGLSLPSMAGADFGNFTSTINQEAGRSARASGRVTINLEDQLRAATELLRGLQIMGAENPALASQADTLASRLSTILGTFARALLDGERGLISANEKQRAEAFNYLVSFLMSFASRTGTRDRLHVFTTNYDRFIEAGAEVAGLHLLDRFVGSLAPLFRASRLDLDIHYNPPGIRGEPRYLEGVARFTKLHGSLDWCEHSRAIRRVGVPFGAASIEPYLEDSGGRADLARLMIYPNAAKDRETSLYPYVELFRDFAAAVCRPNHTLVVFGHSLGDEHLNRVIEDMLTIPSTHVVVMAYDDPLGRILGLYEAVGRPAQMTLLVGSHVGEFRTLVDRYLPKPAIDKTTFRMAELLRSRWSAGSGDRPSPDPAGATAAGEGRIDD
jgi:hypothetical protein